jgi:hypothetical protein
MKKIVLAITMGLTIFVACNDEDLLIKNPHSPTDRSFYITVNGATQGLMAAYDIMQLGEKVVRVEFAGAVCSGDAMAGGERGGQDQMNLQEMMKFQVNPNGIYFQTYWTYLYVGIYRCNLLLSYLENKSELLDFPADDDIRNTLMGEAYFLRALYHFKLQIFYGGYPQLQGDFNNQLLGVRYIDKILPTEEWKAKRPPLQETWDKIAADFQKASTLLKNRDEYSTDHLGRATKGAALAMLGKTYLYQNRFAEAYPIFRDLINTKQYELLGEDGTKYKVTRSSKEGPVEVNMVGFKYRAAPESNNSKESIFDVQGRADHTITWPEGQEGNYIQRPSGPRRLLIYRPTSPGKPDELYSFLLDFWSFIAPTTFFLETAYKDVGCEPRELDPRFKLSVYGPDDSIPYNYPDPTLRKNHPDSVKNDAWYAWPTTGWLTWTYFSDPIFVDAQASLGDNPLNGRYLHFNDLLLMGAEAAVQTGNNADALTWTNRVRTRARNSGTTGFPKDLTSVTKENIYAERRVELAFEYHQFFDIVRTGRANQVLKVDALAKPEYRDITNPITGAVAPQQFGGNFIVGRNEIFPLPQTEIDLSDNKLTQNPKY